MQTKKQTMIVVVNLRFMKTLAVNMHVHNKVPENVGKLLPAFFM
jgi:hypothetical protein